MLLANGASIPTIAGAVEEEEEYARSEANSVHYDGYVTDHTDLASEVDIDESEYRRELLNDKWRMLFDKFDPEGFGEIPLEDFLAALRSPEWKAEIPTNKRDILLTRAKESRVEAVTFQDFVNVMSGKRTRSFKCAVHHRDREICSENDFHLLIHEPPLFRRISDVHDDGDGDGGDSDADEDDGRSYSISAVHFMLRIVTHAREPRGGTDIPRTLYDLRNINIFLLPMTCSYDPTSFFVPFSLCISYAP